MSCQAGSNAASEGPRSLRRVLRRLFNTAMLGAALALGCLALGFVAFVATLDRSETEPSRHAEGIVALTGGADRIADAVALLAKGHADRLLISGVNPSTSRLEIGRLAPEARKLLDCCIELGYAAANTVGNAAETSRWARAHNIHSLIVVTSNYHMPRALAEIGNALPEVELIAFPVVAEPSRPGGWRLDGQRFRLVLAEYLKYLAALARMRLA